jgi:hypothetical protein
MTAYRVKVVLGLALISICIGGCEPGYIKRTEKFADRVKSTVNPDELQAWATNLLIASPNADPRTPITVKEADIPPFIRAISTNQVPDVEISGGKDGFRKSVTVWYGSGFGHWGLEIGFPTLVLTNSETHYFVQWKPGIYFWSGP